MSVAVCDGNYGNQCLGFLSFFFFFVFCFYLQVYTGQAKKYHTIILVLQFYIKRETRKETRKERRTKKEGKKISKKRR